MVMKMAWVTPEEVQARTEIAVTQSKVDAAQFLVELYADTTEESSDAGLISEKNLRLLKLAVAYQAAWMTQHPDAYTTLDVRSVTTDGMSWTVDNPQAGVLAPLAKASIGRLSWKRNRSIYVRSAADRQAGYVPPTLNTTNAELDDYLPGWRPLDC
ncbi:hypothetical protein OG601_24110 [Streptomyces sp. NBC_01239]|uniref:hypothetical protein n=1 Tax=Streptomyces sp. NBC_01239 TaxID=2903792 RepID=UPI00225ACDE2|nr:hypothetical protein [Streptomyces sp. NBC_01239]MCX4813687.1 hypothetical protein [Streptomyces sp. NBC_01239]